MDRSFSPGWGVRQLGLSYRISFLTNGTKDNTIVFSFFASLFSKELLTIKERLQKSFPGHESVDRNFSFYIDQKNRSKTILRLTKSIR